MIAETTYAEPVSSILFEVPSAVENSSAEPTSPLPSGNVLSSDASENLTTSGNLVCSMK